MPGAPIVNFHFKGDGDMEFKNSLYIPDKPPVCLYSSSVDEEKEAIKVWVRQGLVCDIFEYAFFPRHTGILVGIVDFDNIPINGNREMLQESKNVDEIKRNLVRKAFELFKKLIKADTSDDEDDPDTDTDESKKDEGHSGKEENDDGAESGADDDQDKGEGGMIKKSKHIDFQQLKQ